MEWTVNLSRRVAKALSGKKRPPEAVLMALRVLLREIEEYGPVRGNWKNYSRLGPTRHHCHLKAGKPTYVAVWEEVQGSIQLVEVEYVGTHEKAPY